MICSGELPGRLCSKKTARGPALRPFIGLVRKRCLKTRKNRRPAVRLALLTSSPLLTILDIAASHTESVMPSMCPTSPLLDQRIMSFTIATHIRQYYETPIYTQHTGRAFYNMTRYNTDSGNSHFSLLLFYRLHWLGVILVRLTTASA